MAFLRTFGVIDEQVMAVPLIGMMSMKQIIFLMGAFFASYGLFSIGQVIFCPLIVIPAVYFSFVSGKTFSPIGVFMNWFAFITRKNSPSTPKKQKVVKEKNIDIKKKLGFLNVKH